MIKPLPWLCAIVITFFTLNIGKVMAQDGVQRCVVAEADALMRRYHPEIWQNRQQLEQLIQTHQARTTPNAKIAEITIRIPVVVHILHNTKSGVIGGADNKNIDVSQVTTQIQVLNEDFRKKTGTNGFNTNPVGADMNIEFYLANKTPDGQPSDGITRHYLEQPQFDIISDQTLIAGTASWPTDRYLNIYVADYSGDYLGFAQFPSVDLAPFSLQSDILAQTDGVFVDYAAFGTTGVVPTSKFAKTYNLGRTTTHEIGHWLGLIHTWGDSFCGSDFVDDTPEAEKSNNTTKCDDMLSTCSGSQTRNMIENYMDFSPDRCMNIYTEGQKRRVRSVFELSPRRKKLAALSVLPTASSLTVNITPNPAKTDLSLEILLPSTQDVTVELFDLNGRLMYESQFASTASFPLIFSLDKVGQGMHVLRVTTNTESVNKRVMILK